MLEPIPVLIDPDLAGIIPAYLDNRRLDVTRIQAAIAEQDFAVIGHLGHKMKGTGQGYGFLIITEVGINLEIAAEERDMDSVRQNLALLQDYLERVQPQLR